MEDAGRLVASVKFYRMEADAMFELAKLYRDSGDLAAADARATEGLAASQQVGDRYYVPRNLTILADLKARRGRIAEAKALYKHAEDVIDGMLGGDDSYWNSSIPISKSAPMTAISTSCAVKHRLPTDLGIWNHSGSCHAAEGSPIIPSRPSFSTGTLRNESNPELQRKVRRRS